MPINCLLHLPLLFLVEMGKVSSIITIIIISREFIVTGFRIIAAAEGVVIAASWLGKVKTIVQIVSIVAILLDNFPFSYVGFPFDVVALYAATIITILSGIDYIYKNRRLLKENV